MPTYDMQCDNCETVTEVRCLISERETRECEACGLLLTPLFTPNGNFIIPNSFRYSFSDLFGTTSEKDFIKANPDLVPSHELDNIESARDKLEREGREADAKVADIERAMKANRTLTEDKRRKKEKSNV